MSVQQTEHVDSQPIRQNPHQAVPNPRTYGEMAFDTPGVQPISTYRIAPTSNRLQRNMYGNGYSEFMDYSLLMLSRILGMVLLQDACWRARES
jgi:hypothetical protein